MFDRNFKYNFLKPLSKFENLEFIHCVFDKHDYGIKCREILKRIGLYCKKLKVLIVQNLSSPIFNAFTITRKISYLSTY